MKYTVPRKMKPMKLVEMQVEWWNMHEVGPKGFWKVDREANPVINAWHSYARWGARLFGLIHNGAVVSFCAAKFYTTRPEVHIYLNYTPKEFRGQGYAQELKRQLFALIEAARWKDGQPYTTITVDCQTSEGDRLYADGTVTGTNKYGNVQKSYQLQDVK